MPDQESFDMALSLSTGSVVRVCETRNGIAAHFINPLIAPHDRPTVNTFDDKRGRNTIVPMSYEGAEALMCALVELFKQRKDSHG